MRMLTRRLVGMVLAAALCAGPVAAEKSAGTAPAKKSTGSVKKAAPAAENRKLIVYYFHGAARCRTCMKFEALTKAVMDESFADAVKKGRVEFRVVNVEESGTDHFVNDYGLYSKAVVLSDTVDGKQTRWKNLEKIWEKVRDESDFKQYIRDEVASYLKAG
jgi:hypothetical protein